MHSETYEAFFEQFINYPATEPCIPFDSQPSASEEFLLDYKRSSTLSSCAHEPQGFNPVLQNVLSNNQYHSAFSCSSSPCAGTAKTPELIQDLLESCSPLSSAPSTPAIRPLPLQFELNDTDPPSLHRPDPPLICHLWPIPDSLRRSVRLEGKLISDTSPASSDDIAKYEDTGDASTLSDKCPDKRKRPKAGHHRRKGRSSLASYRRKVKNASRERVWCQVEGCPKSFTRVADLQRHEASVHQASRYPCQFCSKLLSRLDARQRHEATCELNWQ